MIKLLSRRRPIFQDRFVYKFRAPGGPLVKPRRAASPVCSTVSFVLAWVIFVISLVPSAFAQTELITNGSFQAGSTGWQLSLNFFADSRFQTCKSCPGYAYVSNSDGSAGNNLAGIMYQAVTIPASATSASLNFWYNITSQDTGSTSSDFLNITIQNNAGQFLANVIIFSNVDRQSLGAYSQLPYDMTPYIGQTVRVNFLATTNSSLPTTFRIDDVSLTYTTSAPVGPGNLTAAALSSTAISLAWADNSNNETGFKVERKMGTSGTFSQIGTQGANLNFFDDTGLNASTQYCYRLRATNGNGDSGYSNESCSTTPGTAPAAPSALLAAALSSSQISLAWADNSNNETGFKVERKVGTNGTFIQIGTQGANLNFFNDSALSASTQYCYRVRATNGNGDSGYSNESCATTQGTGPAAPSNLIATDFSPNQIVLVWTDNSNNETGFKVERKQGTGGTFSQIATQGANLNFFNDSGLSAAT